MHISGYATKKAFREAVAINPDAIWLDDPAVINPISGSVEEILKQADEICVTNHPKRSWYARVYKRGGRIHVE